MPVAAPTSGPAGVTPLRSIAFVFLRLGTTAFGGPAVHVAMMEEEVVRKRGWLTHERFLDYLGATNLIPGPNSTEMAIHVGHAQAGWPGMIVAGASFIVPAMLMVWAAAWAYVTYGALPAVAGVLYGVKPVVIAIVFQALWSLGRVAVKSAWLALLGAGSVVAAAAGGHELAVLAVAGLIAALAAIPGRRRRVAAAVALTAGGTMPATLSAATSAAGTAGFGLWPLFLVFAKIGSVLFGSGYVLLAFLRADLVERLHWITETQLLDAVAVGQVTPGPLSTTATFIGYLLAGPVGALVATLGIFLPAFAFVGISGPIVPRLRRSPTAGAVLDGVNVASLALMVVVSWELGRSALVDPLTLGLALASALALVVFRVNSLWLVLAGALVGWLAV